MARAWKYAEARIARNVYAGTEDNWAILIKLDHQGLAGAHEDRVAALWNDNYDAVQHRDDRPAGLVDKNDKVGASDSDEGGRRFKQESVRVDIAAGEPGDANREAEKKLFHALVRVVNKAIKNHHAIGANPQVRVVEENDMSRGVRHGVDKLVRHYARAIEQAHRLGASGGAKYIGRQAHHRPDFLLRGSVPNGKPRAKKRKDRAATKSSGKACHVCPMIEHPGAIMPSLPRI